jgi:tyrosyl-tRNA synthetase
MLGTADDDVERYLKLFTFIPIDQIAIVMQAHQLEPEKRIAQHLLAKEVVELAHGAKSAKDAEQAHRHAFSFGANNYSLHVLRETLAAAADQKEVKAEQAARALQSQKLLAYRRNFARAASGASATSAAPKPSTNKDNLVTLPYTFVKACTFPQLLYAAGLVSSKSEAQRLIRNKGAYVVRPNSGAPETPFNLVWDKIAEFDVPHEFLIDFEAVVIRTGKTNLRICRVVKTEDFEAKSLDFPGWQEFKAKAAESEKPSEPETPSEPENPSEPEKLS